MPAAGVPVGAALVAAALPVPVAEEEEEEALLLPLLLLPPEDDAPVAAAVAVAQLAVDCTVTPLAAHICWAKEMAACWSAASQASIRQHEMVPMKSGSAQMHLGSVPQSP